MEQEVSATETFAPNVLTLTFGARGKRDKTSFELNYKFFCNTQKLNANKN